MRKRPLSLTICICTMDRPEVLQRCLTSIAAGSCQPDEVLVSDDSRGSEASKAICDMFPNVRYIVGPRRGLCANRNVVVRAATSDYLALLDDDAAVSETFVLQARTSIAELADNVILTGSVLEYGRTIVAGNASFLGHFTDTCEGNLKNVNLNCNVFPRRAFTDACFDENIGYGYEDMDLCSRLVSTGFEIKYEPMLLNAHMPPPKDQQMRRRQLRQADQARFYTSVKRYLLWENDLFKLLAFVVIAPLHRAFHAIRDRSWSDIPCCVSDLFSAIWLALRERSELSEKSVAARARSS